jgi:DNA-binding HxlR family transcriptional regulator
LRSYGQYCSLAKTLDVIGDRWTLLIVRELMLRGASRYTDLRNGLPGIATNLLAERLRDLEEAGIVAREDAPPPVATALFTLTPRGQALKPALHELGRWGIPYMVEGPEPGDEFRGQWLSWPAELFLADREPTQPPIAIELHACEEPMVVETIDGEVHTRCGRAEHPDAVLSGEPYLILALLSGAIDIDSARAKGLQAEGNVQALRRLQPELSNEPPSLPLAPSSLAP